MKYFKSLLLVSIIIIILFVAGCVTPGKSAFAGKAIGNECYADSDCESGEYCDSSGSCALAQVNTPVELGCVKESYDYVVNGKAVNKNKITGCITLNSAGEEGKENSWCPTELVNGKYVSGGKWKWCTPEEIAATQVCGNGKVEGTEQCDDGNTVNSDLCNNQCFKIQCVDSDPNDNPTVSGNVTVMYNNNLAWRPQQDSCASNNPAKVWEVSCSNDVKITAQKLVDCPTGTKCKSLTNGAACVVNYCVYGQNNSDDCVIIFNDANLEKVIKEQLELKANEKVTFGKAKKLITLTFYSADKDKQIQNLSGIEFFINLNNLNLLGNKINDINALKGLIHLNYLNIGFNNISNINVLKGLTDLKELGLYHNQISDVNALKGLTNLETLWLYSNLINDVSQLKDLKNLRELELGDNQQLNYQIFIDGVCQQSKVSITESMNNQSVVQEFLTKCT